MLDGVNLRDAALTVMTVLLLPLLLLPALLCLKLCQRALSAPRRVSARISATSYTRLPAELFSPPLPDGVQYSHHCITNDDSRIHYIRTAAAAGGDGREAEEDSGRCPLLFVHGFPDFVSCTAVGAPLWWVWRHQLAHFASSRRCLAIDLRGFGYSEVGGDKDDASRYTARQQCADIVRLMEAEGIQRLCLVAFDWGGAVAWRFARLHPERLRGVAVIGTPYRPQSQPLPLLTRLRLAPHQLYMLYFIACRQHAASTIESDLQRAFSFIIRGSGPKEHIGVVRAFFCLMLPPAVVSVPPSSLLTAAELQACVRMFSWSGVKYALLWYKANLTRQPREGKAGAAERSSGQRQPAAAAHDSERITVPALMMTAERDRILQPVMAEGMERWCDRLSRVSLRQAGHWAQLEQTEQVKSAIEAFLAQL